MDLEIWIESRQNERGREKGHVNLFSLENRNPQTGVKEHKRKKEKKKKNSKQKKHKQKNIKFPHTRKHTKTRCTNQKKKNKKKFLLFHRDFSSNSMSLDLIAGPWPDVDDVRVEDAPTVEPAWGRERMIGHITIQSM